jgi:hypothetical protein
MAEKEKTRTKQRQTSQPPSRLAPLVQLKFALIISGVFIDIRLPEQLADRTFSFLALSVGIGARRPLVESVIDQSSFRRWNGRQWHTEKEETTGRGSWG